MVFTIDFKKFNKFPCFQNLGQSYLISFLAQISGYVTKISPREIGKIRCAAPTALPESHLSNNTKDILTKINL